MNDFVNWDFLEKTAKSIKAKEIALDPKDRNVFDNSVLQDQLSNNKPNDSMSPGRDSYIRNMPNQIDNSEETATIEVQNTKGKIKKINPDDYEVVIMASGNMLFSGLTSKIASGMYIGIIRSHGPKIALQCIVKDYIKNPSSFQKLNFIQAKLAISSFVQTLGHLPTKALTDISERLNQTEQKELKAWLNDRNLTKCSI